MMLEFNGITGFDQRRLYEIHVAGGGGNKNIEIFISELNKLMRNRIKYRNDLGLTDNDIKTYINNDDSVCVNLYLEPDGKCGHSHIIYGYDDNKNFFYVVDPQPTNN